MKSEPSPSTEAESLYARLLTGPPEARNGRLAELIQAHPELASRLRRLHRDCLRAERVLAALHGGRSRGGETGTPEELEGAPRYEDLGPVARGGMGEVRRVLDTRLGRTLAMKVLADEPSGRSWRGRRRLARFLAEARILGRLQHPAIVPVHALGLSSDGRPCFTMPLIAGEDFARIIARVHAGDDEWALERAVGLLGQVCDAVAYAHSRGVVHRDLKPANVLVGRFGEVHVVDWGLAKVIAGGAPPDTSSGEALDELPGNAAGCSLETFDGDVLGTPAYMSPEQAAGRQDEVGPAADVYSLGAMLHHLLVGRAPFARSDGSLPSSSEVLEQLVRAGPRPLLELAPQAPPELVAICRRAMAREPSRRYRDARALARDLRAWREGRVVRAYESGLGAELRKWVARNRALSALALLALLGLVGVAALQARAARAARAYNARLEDANRGLARANSVAEERLASLQRSLYFHDVALAQNALETFNTANLRALLADAPTELRGWEWSYLWRLSDSSRWTGRGHEHFVVSVAFTPDSRRVVSGGRDGVIGVWDVGQGKLVRRIEARADMIESVAVSPDGSLVASGSRDHTVRLWDLASGAERARMEGHRDVVRAVAFAPEGDRLASGSFDDTVRIWSVPSGELVSVLPGRPSDVLALAWSPRGDRIVSGSYDGQLLFWDAHDYRLVRAIPAGGDYRIDAVSFSPDGRFVAVGSQERRLGIFDVATGREVQRLLARTGSYVAAFSPDGRELISAEFGALRLHDLSDSERVIAFLGHRGGLHAGAISPDGRWIATGGDDGTVRLWDAHRDPAVLALQAEGENIHSVAFAPDSCRLAWAGRNGTIQVRDADSGAPVTGWSTGQLWVGAIAFSPRGDTIVSGGADGTLRLWEARSGSPRGGVRAHSNWVRSVAFDRAGQRLVSASEDGTVAVWTYPGLVELARLEHPRGVVHAEFHPSEERVLTSGWDGCARVWDLGASRPRRVLAAHSSGACFAAYSPDGARIATGGGDRAVRVWEARTGRRLFELSGHEQSVTGVRYAPDGSRILTCGWDGMVKVWDAATGTLAITLQGDEYPLRSLDASPDGERLAAAGLGRQVFVWSAAGARAQGPSSADPP